VETWIQSVGFGLSFVLGLSEVFFLGFGSKLFACLFVVIKPENPFFAAASRPGREEPLGVYPLGPA
jgi:hypothetical protein